MFGGNKEYLGDMFAAFAALLLCLIHRIQSAPPMCEELTQPVDPLDLHQLEGRWALIAGSLNHSASVEALRLRDSITMYFSNTTEPSAFSYAQINRFGDRCQYLSYRIVAEGDTFTFDVANRFNLTASFVRTSCPDCVVMRWLVQSKRRTSLDLYLLSRRRELGQREIEEFRDQLTCFSLPEPVLMDPTKELCADEAGNQPTATSEDVN